MGIQDLVRRTAQLIRGGRASQEISPPVLTDPVRFPYGPFKFKIQTAKRVSCTILASSDFSHWNPITAEQTTADSQEYVDSEAPKFSYRFYRAIAGGLPSATVLGFVSITLPPGFSLIANPFQRGNNIVAESFKGWKDGTTVNKFDTLLVRLTENAVKNGKWTNSNMQLFPGEGAIFFNPTDDYKTHSFVGEVREGSSTVPIPSGFSLRSSLVPQAGNLLDDLKFPISEGDVVHLFDRDRQKYTLHPYENGKWTAGAPVLSMGEAFWVAKAEPGNWSKTLSFGESPN